MVFAVVSLALLMAAVDQTIVATALPTIQHDLHANVTWGGWTLTGYGLGQVLCLPIAGRISDQFGRKKVFLGAVTLFSFSSLACGLANNVYLLVGLRIVQAIGGGAFLPSATGMVSDSFGADRDRAIGLFSSIFPIGGMAGPILGGVFTTYWSWRLIFFVNVPIGVLLIALGLVVLPTAGKRDRARLDVRGVLLLAAVLVPAMLAITFLGSGRVSLVSFGFVAPELVAGAALVLLLRHAGSAQAPFMPAALLHGRGFGVMHFINFLFGCAALGLGALVPLYAHERLGLDPLRAGTLLTARAVGVITVAGLAVVLLRRTGYRRPMFVGFALLAAGLALIALVPDGGPRYAWLAVAAGICGLGIGTLTPASNNASLQLAPESAGSISGLRGMFRQVGSIVSISVTTALISRSDQPAVTLSHVFLVVSVVVVCSLPLIALVPEHRGAW